MVAPNLNPFFESIEISNWWKNRGGDVIVVGLTFSNGRHLIDLRTWFTNSEGKLKPGKGFSCNLKHLPRIVEALSKAFETARKLGLISEEIAQSEKPRSAIREAEPAEPVGKFSDIGSSDAAEVAS